MNPDEIQRLVRRALDTLTQKDRDLLDDHDASEWAIAHRLATYLEREAPGWHVDCEYNRQGLGRDPKALHDAERVRPDIILHHRGRVEIEHNLLIVEMKKRQFGDDLAKVREYTAPPAGDRRFQYQYGLAIAVLDGPQLRWFAGGEEI